jgi:hypothetical protein
LLNGIFNRFSIILNLSFKKCIENGTEVIKMISPFNWVLIVCTLILAIIALFGPYINELWKRKKFAPKLKMIF